jgi:hypothetical protein
MEGNVVPELQRLALIVLPQPISVGAVRAGMVYLRVDPIKTAQPPAARKGAEARDGSLPLAHDAHAEGWQMGGGPSGVARGG